jgi:hypothetical protein
MSVRVGINGFGRIGRNFLRAAKAQGADIDVANLPKPKTPTGLVELDLGTDEDGDWADEGQEPIDSGVDPEPVDELDVLGDEPDAIAVDADGSVVTSGAHPAISVYDSLVSSTTMISNWG